MADSLAIRYRKAIAAVGLFIRENATELDSAAVGFVSCTGAPSGDYDRSANVMFALRKDPSGLSDALYVTVDNGTTWTTWDAAISADLVFPTSSELTIATGAITATQLFHTVDTEADAASDDLDTISGLAAGELAVFKAEDGARSVVFKHGVDNIVCPLATDVTLAEAEDYALCIGDGSNVIVLSASLLAGNATSSSTATVTEDEEEIREATFINPAAAGTNIVAQMGADVDESTWGNITQPDFNRAARVDFSAGWDGGDIEITGIDMAGDDTTETITAAAGSVVEGVKGWKLIRRVRNLGTWSAGTADVEYSANLAVFIGAKTPTLVEAYEFSTNGRDAGASMSAAGLLTTSAAPNGALDYFCTYTLAGGYTDAGHTHQSA
ncbi:hypothetical protein HN937_30530 [Candidatus Poribacteria bacterium]|jgi:hypothetical protein|nr:hypothetical protein [Candidatus Poribacteria bacterium]